MALKDRVDGLLKKATDAGDVPGVVAMATDRDGTLYEGAFGKRILGEDAAMGADSVVWIASMTKALTGACAMQLVEQGRLELDKPASTWLPELGSAMVLEGFDAHGKPRTRNPKRPVTLRHLLTHTAGFSYEIWSKDIQRYQQALGLPGVTTCQNAALRTPLLFDPGERWDYGINIDFVGKAVEAVTGRKLGAAMRDKLLEPLGMRDTAFRITPAMRERLTKIHQRGEDGKLTPLMDLEIPQDPEFEMGGGGLYGTAGDYLKFVRMMLNGGKANGRQILKPETVRTMSSNHIGDVMVTPLRTAIPSLSNDVDVFPGMPKKWGLSFLINTQAAPSGRSAGSLAWAGLANTYYWIDPVKGIGGVFLSQVLPFADAKAYPLFEAFETAVYQSAA